MTSNTNIQNMYENLKQMIQVHKDNNIQYGFVLCGAVPYCFEKKKWDLQKAKYLNWLNNKKSKNYNSFKDYIKDVRYNYKDFENDNYNKILDSINLIKNKSNKYLKMFDISNPKKNEKRDIIYFVSDTFTWQRLDIDNPIKWNEHKELKNYTSFNKLPFIYSRNQQFKTDKYMKKYKHYFIKLDKEKIKKHRAQYSWGDLLNGQASFYSLDNKISRCETFKNRFDNFNYNFIMDINNNNNIKKKSKIIKNIEIKKYISNKNNQLPIEGFKKLIKLIPDEYFTDYSKWIDMGIIFKDYMNNDEGFTLFFTESQRCLDSSKVSNYEEMRKKWDSFPTDNDNKKTLGTIKFYAKKHKFLEYKHWCSIYCKTDESLTKDVLAFDKKYFHKLLRNESGDYKTIYEAFDYFNKYVYFIQGESSFYLHRIWNRDDEEIDFNHYSKDSKLINNFKQYFFYWDDENDKGQKIKKKKQFIKLFLDFSINENVIIYDNVNYEPGKIQEYQPYKYNVYNTWRGWKVQYDKKFIVDKSKFNLIDKHLKEVICWNKSAETSNLELYGYMCKWLKLILIGRKPKTAFVLDSLDGSGKNIFFQDFFAYKIMGKKYYTYFRSLKDLTDKFSILRCNKSLIICDEISSFAGDHKTMDLLKSMISQEEMKLEKKGIDPYNIKDLSGFVFFSNHKDTIQVKGKGDRRYILNECSYKYCKNKPYFNALYKQIQDEDCACHFFHYIMNMDITDFNPENIPDTEDRRNAQLNSTPILSKFIMMLFNNIKNKMIDSKMTSYEIFSYYKWFINIFGDTQKYLTPASLCKKLMSQFIKIKNCYKRINSNGERVRGFNFSKNVINHVIDDQNKRFLFEDYITTDKINKHNTFNDCDDLDYGIMSD